MIDPETQRELRQVRRVLVLAGLAAGVLTIGAFRQIRANRFTEIDVERINVIEKDGKLRLTISNAARLPDPIIGGKSYPLRGGTGSGSAGACAGAAAKNSARATRTVGSSTPVGKPQRATARTAT